MCQARWLRRQHHLDLDQQVESHHESAMMKDDKVLVRFGLIFTVANLPGLSSRGSVFDVRREPDSVIALCAILGTRRRSRTGPGGSRRSTRGEPLRRARTCRDGTRASGTRSSARVCAARESRDLEIRTRAAGLAAKIEAALLTQPTRIRLDFEDVSLPDAVRNFSQQSGFKLALTPENLPPTNPCE